MNYHILLPLVSLTVALVLALRALRHRSARIAVAFAVLMLALAAWSLSVALEHASPDLPAKVFWMKMSYLGILSLAPAWLAFTLRYANEGSWLTRRNVSMLVVLPIATFVMVWTNGIHHLMWRDIWLDTSFSPPVDAVTHGAWFWVQAGYSYLLILAGTLTLVSVFVRSSAVYRKQVGVMLVAALVPWAANLAYLAGIGPFQVVDPTPLAFAVTGAAFSWGLFRLHLLNIVPVAHEAVFRNMVDGVIVLDAQGLIVELNTAAQRIVGRDRAAAVGRPYGFALPAQAGLLGLGPAVSDLEAAISPGGGEAPRHYVVSVSPMVTRGQLSGHLVLLHDDTVRVKAEAESRERVRLETELLERSRSEQTLRASEARYRNLVQNATTGILVSLPGGRILSANRAALEILGYATEQELLQTPAASLVVDTPEIRRQRVVFRESGVVRGIELLFRRKDGSEFWASLSAVAQVSESGETEYLSLIDDVTERRRAETALRESEERYRSLFEQSLDATVIASLDGAILQANEAFLRLTGYTRYELPRLRVEDLYAYPLERADFLKRILALGSVQDEVRFKRKDGSAFECARSVVALRDESGAVVSLQGVIRDITEEKRQKKALADELARRRILLEQSRDGIVVLDQDGNAVESNRKFADMLGYTPEEVLKLHVWDWEAVASRETVEGMLRSVDEAGDHFETQHRRKDGTVYDVEISTNGAVFDGRKLIFCVCRDVTERKRAEAALRESEARYRALFENSLDAIYIGTFDGKVIDVNKAWLDLLGYERADLPGLHASALYADPEERASFMRTMEESGFVRDEVRYRRKDGAVFDCQRVQVALKDSRGQIVALQGINRDITEQKQAVARLRESEARYRSLFEQSGEAVSVIAPDGRILEANSVWLTLFGCIREELPGLNMADFYVSPTRREEFLAKMAAEGHVKDEVLFKRKDGTVFLCERNVVSQRDPSGVVIGFQATARDTTEIRRAERALRESEERFRGVFEHGPMGIAIVDLTTDRFVRANLAYQQIVGYTEEELLQLRVGDVTVLEDREGQRELVQARLRASEGGVTMEKRYLRKDGAIRDVYVVVESLRLAPDSPPLAVASVVDITDRKRTERELAESREEMRLLAQRVEKAREDERTAIARELHDRVGQMLTALKLDLDRLGRTLEPVSPETVSLLAGMESMVNASVDDVRRISSELRPGALDDLGLAGAIEWELDQFRQRTGIAFTFEHSGADDCLEPARTTALFRIFQELVTNVVRHAGARTARISLGQQGGACVLTVADDGRGIDEREVNDRRSIGIVGIRERLLPFGGELHFVGVPGRGTTARVIMPLR